MSETAELLVRHGYLVLFLAVFAEQIGLPIPSIPVLLAGGALARTGPLSMPLVLLVTFAAALASDLAWYEVGRRRGLPVMRLLCRISLEPDSCVRNTEELFARHGARSLLIAQFVPAFNTAAPPMAGVFGMRRRSFLLWDALGTLLWIGVFTGLGFVFADELERVLAAVSRAGAGVALLAVVLLGLWIAIKWVQRRLFLRKLRIDRITPEELSERLAAGEDLVVVDLRHAKDFELDPRSIPGALHLPAEVLEARRHEIPGDREIVLLCT